MAAPTYYDWLTLLAILIGPLIGIWVTRLIDERKQRDERRWAIFEGLVKTKGLEMSPEHVSNLNMIPLMFPKEGKVTSAHSELMKALNDPALGSDDPGVGEAAYQKQATARQNLITAVGRAVKADLPDGVLERLGYAPQAWVTDYNEGQRLRRDLLEALNGRKAMHMVAGVWELPTAPAPAQLENDGEAVPPPAKTKKGRG